MAKTDEALILAGGFGTRLQSVVRDVPKPLAPVGGRPFIAWLLDALAAQGMRRMVLAVGYMGEVVEQALGSSWRGAALIYSREPEPLGTGGAVSLAAGCIQGDSFFLLNGDTWLELDYGAFDRAAVTASAPLSMALARVEDVSRYGAVRVEDNRVAGFVEKGSSGAGHINAGVYRVTRDMLGSFPDKHRFSFENEVLAPAVEQGLVSAFTQTRGFIDIGIPADYARAATVLPTAEDAV